MGISVTGVKPGNTTVTINSKTSPNISKKVPVTVKSRNLLAYGPASANALTVTVAQDGSLDFDSGTESVPLYKGVRWELDVPEGIVGVPLILSYTGDVPGTLVIGLYANANSLGGVYQGKNNTAVTIPKGTTRVELRIGSSPRMRGKLICRFCRRCRMRIIPAHAGQTTRTTSCPARYPDHPRACGANLGKIGSLFGSFGSSPRMRGKRFVGRDAIKMHRIIPAHAGQTSKPSRCRCRRPDHPRACGANGAEGVAPHLRHGSSPRMRGKHDSVR